MKILASALYDSFLALRASGWGISIQNLGVSLALFLDHQSLRLENGLSGSSIRIATGNPLNFSKLSPSPNL